MAPYGYEYWQWVRIIMMGMNNGNRYE